MAVVIMESPDNNDDNGNSNDIPDFIFSLITFILIYYIKSLLLLLQFYLRFSVL